MPASTQDDLPHLMASPTLADKMRRAVTDLAAWLNSPSIRGVLKCSFAYGLASLATFVPALSEFLGRPGGKHVVATITVYFHASRSVGSMIEAVLIAVVAIAYAELVSLASMATSVLFGAVLGLVAVAHVLVVVVFIGGGFGFMAWVKQRMGNPLVNVASTLASLAIISVVTKENHVVDNVFSNQKIVQVLKILVMGVTCSTAVNLLLWRVSAQDSLRSSVDKSLGALCAMFEIVSASISDVTATEGRTDFSTAAKNFSAARTKSKKDMREAWFEYHFVGHEKRSHLQESVVQTIGKMVQSLGGFRSASQTLHAVLPSPQGPVAVTRQGYNWTDTTTDSARLSSEMSSGFFDTVRPSVNTLTTEILHVLQNRPSEDNWTFDENMSTALKMFASARLDALEDLYKMSSRADSPESKALSEQVAAACGHVTFSLQLFAEEVQRYAELLDDLRILDQAEKRTWYWLCFWRGKPKLTDVPLERPAEPEPATSFSLSTRAARSFLLLAKKLARDDILFGIKVGIGAALWASLAFISETRDWYNHYRGEWGLLSFMIVCSMTVGASNTTGWSRFLGTLLGAFFSLLNWNVSRGNAVALAFLGWATSFFTFHLMVAQGKAPLGRMTLLAYNVSALYAFSMSRKLDDDDGTDEGLDWPDMWTIATHRVISVTAGILWGLIVCRVVWPISARQEFKEGLSSLCLQMGLIWKRGPLAILLRTDCSRSYLKTGEQDALQQEASRLESLCQSAAFEFELQGPFPLEVSGRLLATIHRILDGFYAMSLVTVRGGRLTDGERALLQFTADERAVLCDRICHIFHVIASSIMLEFPLTNAVPNIVKLRDNLLARVFEFRKRDGNDGALGVEVEESDYALLYAYVLVTGQIADELNTMEKEIKGMYGVASRSSLRR